MERDPKVSAPAQLELLRLTFAVEPGNLPAPYAQALTVRVQDVFGDARIAAGGDYRINGEYTLAARGIDAMALATAGRMTGNRHPLSPGTHSFSLYGHTDQVEPNRQNMLAILVFPKGQEYRVALIRLLGDAPSLA